MKTTSLYSAILFSSVIVFAQEKQPDLNLRQLILEKDSLLFEIGFNTCQIQVFEELISEQFEFFHDQSGITNTKTEFIEDIRSGLCNLPYKAIRELNPESVEVYPLKNDGVLYGAIEVGEHYFYALEGDNHRYLTSIAKFTHTWVLENEQWKLRSALSYDHVGQGDEDKRDALFFNTPVTNEWLKQNQIPALGIGYIENGRVVQTSVFGELTKGEHAPLNTIWNVASLTKPITAMVVLKLVNAGLWDLDEPLDHYYIDPDLATDSRTKKLTTRIILSHQSGLPNWRGNNKDGKLAFEFEPGERYQYSGEGFEYLRKALEAKFGKSLDKLARDLIFDPLKMSDTRFTWSEEVDERRFAQWHKDNGKLYKTEKSTEVCAADNLLTTVEDYCRFLVHVLHGGGLSENLFNEMVSQQTKINDYKHFGLGWWVDQDINSKGDFALVHGGDDIGVHTIAFIIPQTRQALLIFTNSDNGTNAFADVLLNFLGEAGEGILRVEMQ